MPRDYTSAEWNILREIVRWRDVVRQELDTIDSWRNCDPNEWLFHDRTQEPRDLLRLTGSIVGWIGGRMPSLDPKPFLRVRKIINEWYSPCRSRDTILPQVALVELVERCQILTLAVEERIEQDRVLAGGARPKTPRKHSTRKKVLPTPSCDKLMESIVQSNPDAKGWTIRQWRLELASTSGGRRFALSTIHGTKVWEFLQMAAMGLKAEAARKARPDRRRKPKHGDRD